MKKIYAYFCVFFTGSLLPFLIVEYYFQDYGTFGLIAILAGVIFTFCILLDNLRGKIISKVDVRNKKIKNFKQVQLKEESARGLSYYFRNIL